MIQDCKNKNNSKNVRLLVDFLKIISEENRLRIICLLQKNEQCVCEIWKFLDLPQNLVSHHLKVLKDFGLLDSKKDGLKVCYSINRKEIKKYKEILEKVLSER